VNSRLLLVAPSARAGGSERAITGLARGLPKAGFDPHVVLLEDGPLAGWLRDAGCRVSVLPAGRFRQAARTLSTVRRLRRLIAEDEAVAVISNSPKGHIYGGLAALGAVPAVWWQHGIYVRSPIDLVAAAVPAAAIACVSDTALGAQRLGGRAAMVKIGPGLPIATIAARAGDGLHVRTRLGWEENAVVGIVGRLQPWKGQEVFLEAAASVASAHPRARFMVLGGAITGGEGDYPDRLKALAGSLGLADVTYFAGHQDDAYEWMDALDVVVHASDCEPFGLVVVEAMALGKPVVATDCGGPCEIVEPGRSGLLVPPRQPDALAEVVIGLLADEPFAAGLGRAAAERATLFSEERTAGEFAALVRRVTGVADAAPARP